MKTLFTPELKHGPTPYDGHTAVVNDDGSLASLNAYVPAHRSGNVGIQLVTASGKIAHSFTPPAEAMMCAEAIVRAVADADPEGFDALWMGLVASIRSARTRPVDLPTDLTCDKVNQQEEQYLQGTNETTA